MKDRLVTPGYCFILAANFLLYFRLLAIDTRIAILSIRSIQCRKLHYRHHSFLLYGSCLMHPSVLRIFSGQFCPQTVVSVSLFHLHDHVCRIHHCRVTHFIYPVPHHTRRIIRHGDRGRQYGSHRHHALIKTRRRSRILRTLQQHSHGSRADVRFVPARCRYELYHHILLLAGFLYCRVHLCFLSENPV